MAKFGFGLACALAVMVYGAHAQVSQPAVPVPLSGCGGCAPTDSDPCCKANMLSCFRTDTGPVVTSAGTPATILAGLLDCDNCIESCPCCPVLISSDARMGDCLDCGRAPSLRCMNIISLSWNQAITISLSSTLTGTLGAPGVASIQAALTSSIGVTLGVTFTFQGECGWPEMPPCNHYQTTPSMSGFVGASAEMTHVWSASGTWTTKGGCAGTPCPIAATPWSVEVCRVEYSTISGNPYVSQSCGTPVEMPCP